MPMKRKLTSLFIAFCVVSIGLYLWQRPTYDFEQDWPEPPISKAMKSFQDTYLTNYYYRGSLGTRNYFAHYEAKSNKIENPLFIITGLEDITENWWETASGAFEQGFRHVFVIEIRGQGKSSRVPGNAIRASHVNDFSYYTKDIIYFLRAFKKEFPDIRHPPFVLAHSAGGLVFSSSLAAIKDYFPEYYPKAFSYWAPFVMSDVSPWINNWVMISILSTVDIVAQNFGIILLGRRFSLHRTEENGITHDFDKFHLSEQLRLYQGNNSIGVSLRWGIEAISKANNLYYERGYNFIDRPCLILVAENDKIVSNEWDIANPQVEKIIMPGAFHALHIEREDIFREALHMTMSFFKSHLKE